MDIKRDKYLNELISKRKNGLIKVITGIRRCGKSYLLSNIYYKYLINEGVSKNRIITFSFDVDEDIYKLDKYFPKKKQKFINLEKNIIKLTLRNLEHISMN